MFGEGDLPGRPEPATTEISVAQLAEVDRITTEDAYAEALAAEQLWELESAGRSPRPPTTTRRAAARGQAAPAAPRGARG